MNRFTAPLLAFAALLVVFGIGLTLNPREIPSPLVGKPAPAFDAESLHDPGSRFSPADLRGKVWLLNVWASWCVACREEHPLMVEYARRKTVPIYGLNYKDTREAGLQWLSRLGNPYVASLFDVDGKLGIDFGVYGVPETFIIDRQGVIRHKHIGPVTPEVLREKFEPLIKSLQG